MSRCRHASDTERSTVVRCALGLYGGRPHVNLCRQCDRFEHAPGSSGSAGSVPGAPSRGLGDTVAKVIHGLSGGRVKPCASCKRRQAMLNRALPYQTRGGAGEEGSVS